MPFVPKVTYRVNVISIKIPMAFFTEIGKNDKIHTEPQKTKAIWRKNNKVGVIIPPNVKL